MYDQNKTHYVVATVIIAKDGKFLIVKRAPHEKAQPNKWTVPGGKLETKDYKNLPFDTEDAWYNVLENLARREVMEEVGLKIKNIKYATSLVYIRSDNIPTLIISLFADYDSGEVKLCPALTEWKWTTTDDARKYDLIDGIQEELEMVNSILKGRTQGEWKKG